MSAGRRRERSSKQERSWLSGRIIWIVGGVLAIIILAPVVLGFFDNGGDVPDALASEVEEFPDEGRDHVDNGTTVEYDTDPPTSGPHYPNWAEPLIHRENVPYEMLVHNLEHGHIVIYYSRDLSDEAASKITDLNNEYNGDWDAVLAAPREDQDEELVLTAWTYMLELEEYDEELVDAFVDAYRGRGPENPVR